MSMFDEINKEINVMCEELKSMEIELLFNEDMDSLFAEYEMQQYASNSYDCDAEFYGVK